MLLDAGTTILIEMLVLLENTKEPVKTSVLAEKLGTDPNTLQKYVQFARKTGLVQTQRGKGGGILPAQKLKDVTLWDVVRYTVSSNSRDTAIAMAVDKRVQEMFHSVKLSEFNMEK